MRKKLGEIVQWVNGEWRGPLDRLELIVESVTCDTRKEAARSLFVPLKGERFDGHDFVDEALSRGAVAAFWKRNHPRPPQPGMPVILVDDPLEALQRLAHLYRLEVGCTLVAVTGSNGKTTTKDLIAAVVRRKYRVHSTEGNLNNHIGVPLTLLSMPEDTEVAVVEMGMNHFGEIELLSRIARPDIAVITNIGESHIQFLGSRAGIARAKLEILSGMKADGILLYPGEEPLIREAEAFRAFPGKKVSCGFTEECELKATIAEDLGLKGFRLMLGNRMFEIPIPGRHNAQNCLFAIGVGTLLQIDLSEIEKGLQQADRTKMRMEQLKGKNGVTLINDAYNASPTSVKAALDFFAGLKGWKTKILVLGDIRELGDYSAHFHEEIGQLLDPKSFSHVFLIGEETRHVLAGARKCGFQQVERFTKREELIGRLEKHLDPGTVILFKASRAVRLEEIVNRLM